MSAGEVTPGATPAVAEFIQLRDIIAGYEGKVVVPGLSVSVGVSEQVSLLGPSGCGKSTVLRCIAGLETPLSGEIVIAGETVFSSARGINLPPEKRHLAMVFQSYAIWPHMSVFENVAYGLRAQRVRGPALQEKVGRALHMVGMEAFADRPATALSGGQQQRVALARAYAAAPRAILLDEPLSNLDAALRVRMRDELKEIQRGTGLTTLYVTHDQEEAMAMSDRIVIMRAGRIEQAGPPLTIYNQPRTRFVADFIGAANILEGLVEVAPDSAELVARVGTAHVHIAPESLEGRSLKPGDNCLIAVRTVYPQLAPAAAADEANSWVARIARRTTLGDIVHYLVDWPGGQLRVQTTPAILLDKGDAVLLRIPRQRAVLLEPDEAPPGRPLP